MGKFIYPFIHHSKTSSPVFHSSLVSRPFSLRCSSILSKVLMYNSLYFGKASNSIRRDFEVIGQPIQPTRLKPISFVCLFGYGGEDIAVSGKITLVNKTL